MLGLNLMIYKMEILILAWKGFQGKLKCAYKTLSTAMPDNWVRSLGVLVTWTAYKCLLKVIPSLLSLNMNLLGLPHPAYYLCPMLHMYSHEFRCLLPSTYVAHHSLLYSQHKGLWHFLHYQNAGASKLLLLKRVGSAAWPSEVTVHNRRTEAWHFWLCSCLSPSFWMDM